MKFFLSFLLPAIFLVACFPPEETGKMEVLGWSASEEVVLVNFKLHAVNPNGNMEFEVDKEGWNALTLQFKNGLETEPDVEATRALPNPCSKYIFNSPDFEVVCQMAFPMGERYKLPRALYYRWQGNPIVEYRAEFPEGSPL